MKEVLFATGNTSKVARYKDKLLERGIVLKSLKDIDADIDVDENGSTAIENATIKAKAYNEDSNLQRMATDDTMYIVGIQEEKKTGNLVKKVNGKRINDKEMKKDNKKKKRE